MRDALRRIAQVALGIFLGGAALMALSIYVTPRYRLYVERFELDRERQRIENKHRIELIEIEAARDKHRAELEDQEAIDRMYEKFMAFLGHEEEGRRFLLKYIDDCERNDPEHAAEYAKRRAAVQTEEDKLTRLVEKLKAERGGSTQ